MLFHRHFFVPQREVGSRDRLASLESRAHVQEQCSASAEPLMQPDQKISGLNVPNVTKEGSRLFRATSFELFLVSVHLCLTLLCRQSLYLISFSAAAANFRDIAVVVGRQWRLRRYTRLLLQREASS